MPAVKSGDFNSQPKLKSKITKGQVPMVFRGEVWKMLIGNDMKLNT